MVSRELVDNITLKCHASITKTKCYISSVYVAGVHMPNVVKQNRYMKVVLTNVKGFY